MYICIYIYTHTCVCVCVCVVWCGVVWCGVVWCGVVWCGVVWCGVVCVFDYQAIYISSPNCITTLIYLLIQYDDNNYCIMIQLTIVLNIMA